MPKAPPFTSETARAAAQKSNHARRLAAEHLDAEKQAERARLASLDGLPALVRVAIAGRLRRLAMAATIPSTEELAQLVTLAERIDALAPMPAARGDVVAAVVEALGRRNGTSSTGGGSDPAGGPQLAPAALDVEGGEGLGRPSAAPGGEGQPAGLAAAHADAGAPPAPTAAGPPSPI